MCVSSRYRWVWRSPLGRLDLRLDTDEPLPWDPESDVAAILTGDVIYVSTLTVWMSL